MTFAYIRRRVPIVLLSITVAAPLAAQPLPAPQNVVSLSASASTELERDWLTVVFSTTRSGADPAAIQSQLKQALDAALAEARKIARPGQVEVETGNFTLHPRYQPKGGVDGWQGSAELVVQGRDAQAIAQLTGRIQTLTIARVGYSLSRQAREQVEADVAAQAIARFRARAGEIAKQFGFGGYTLREVNVASDGAPPHVPMYRMQAARSPIAADEALPVEAGKATVGATVSGSVQLQ